MVKRILNSCAPVPVVYWSAGKQGFITATPSQYASCFHCLIPSTVSANRSGREGVNSYPHPVVSVRRLMKRSCRLMGRIDKYMGSWQMFSDCLILRTMHAAFQVNNTVASCIGNAVSMSFIAIICTLFKLVRLWMYLSVACIEVTCFCFYF